MPQTRDHPPESSALDARSEFIALAQVLSEVASALEEVRGPSEPPEPAPPDSSQPLVGRRCPYCHDSLGAGGRVLCAGCVTPHHQACFQEHGGCSLLGCGAERSLDLSGPTSRVLCAACGELTPSNAPFCSKCGERHAEDTWSASNQAERARLQAFLRAAALVLFVAFAGGAALGSVNRRAAVVQFQGAASARDLQQELALKEHLRAVQRAQIVFARDDLDGDGEPNYAVSVAELRVALDAAEALAAPDLPPAELQNAREDLSRTRWFASAWRVVLTRTRDGRQVAIGRELGAPGKPTWSCDLQGRIETDPDLQPGHYP